MTFKYRACIVDVVVKIVHYGLPLLIFVHGESTKRNVDVDRYDRESPTITLLLYRIHVCFRSLQ